MQKILILAVLAGVLALGECGQRVDIILSGRDIPKEDAWSEVDPFIKVYYKFDGSHSWINYGQTTKIDNDGNANWPEVFSFDYVGGNTQRVKYELWDSDVQFDDLIATLELPLGEIVSSANQHGGMAVERAFPSGKGRLLMKVRIDGMIP